MLWRYLPHAERLDAAGQWQRVVTHANDVSGRCEQCNQLMDIAQVQHFSLAARTRPDVAATTTLTFGGSRHVAPEL